MTPFQQDANFFPQQELGTAISLLYVSSPEFKRTINIMKLSPSLCVLAAVALAGALLIGCEGGIDPLEPGSIEDNELVSAYVDPINPTPGVNRRSGGDGDLLPVIDGDAQDREWAVARPLFVYVSGERAMGGRGFYVELRSIWSDEARLGDRNYLYFLARWADDTLDILPDYWLYARSGGLGLVPSPQWIERVDNNCDSTALYGANWIAQNQNGSDDQLALLFDMAAVGDPGATGPEGSYAEAGCQIACHSGGGKNFGTNDTGKLDLWVWSAGRTNAVESTAYPELTRVDKFSGKPVSQYPLVDTSNTWPAWMEDRSLSPAGMSQDARDPNYKTWQGYTGQIYTQNSSTIRSVDGQPIPEYISQKVIIRREGTGGPPGEDEDEGPVNGGLPLKLYLFGPQAGTFSECDSSATTRPVGNNYPNWSQQLMPGETDVMPGYLLWVPSGSAADVRAKGEFRDNPAKRFTIWQVEIRRPMTTGFDDDIAFDPNNEYTFTLAVFDRSSQVHSGSGPLRLKFQPSLYAKPGTAAQVTR